MILKLKRKKRVMTSLDWTRSLATQQHLSSVNMLTVLNQLIIMLKQSRSRVSAIKFVLEYSPPVRQQIHLWSPPPNTCLSSVNCIGVYSVALPNVVFVFSLWLWNAQIVFLNAGSPEERVRRQVSEGVKSLLPLLGNTSAVETCTNFPPLLTSPLLAHTGFLMTSKYSSRSPVHGISSSCCYFSVNYITFLFGFFKVWATKPDTIVLLHCDDPPLEALTCS